MRLATHENQVTKNAAHAITRLRICRGSSQFLLNFYYEHSSVISDARTCWSVFVQAFSDDTKSMGFVDSVIFSPAAVNYGPWRICPLPSLEWSQTSSSILTASRLGWQLVSCQVDCLCVCLCERDWGRDHLGTEQNWYQIVHWFLGCCPQESSENWCMCVFFMVILIAITCMHQFSSWKPV
jgi:hypothetical protein